MKKIIFIAPLLALLLTSCLKESVVQNEGNPFVEFDANIFNAPTAPYNYTVITRNVPYGYTSATTYPLLTRASGTIRLRVNLVGKTLPKDQVITYSVLNTPTPVAPNALAVSGTHFTTGNQVIIPANSTFGELTLNILNPGTSSTTLREVHLQLEGSESVRPSNTYNKVAVRISQN